MKRHAKLVVLDVNNKDPKLVNFNNLNRSTRRIAGGGGYTRISLVMPTKFATSPLLLGFVDNERHFPTYTLLTSWFQVNKTVYIEILDRLVKSWIESVHTCSPRTLTHPTEPTGSRDDYLNIYTIIPSPKSVVVDFPI